MDLLINYFLACVIHLKYMVVVIIDMTLLNQFLDIELLGQKWSLEIKLCSLHTFQRKKK